MGGQQDALLGSVTSPMSWSCRVVVLLKDSNLFIAISSWSLLKLPSILVSGN